MSAFLLPESEAELAAMVIDAGQRRAPLSIEGGGTKSGLGRPMQTAASLSTSMLAGVTLYEPSELVISARSGTLVAEVEALLVSRGQRLAFEPPDLRGLYGAGGAPTIGAVAAANLSGPRRVVAGAARDSLIGVRAVNGTGEVIKSGGRVMKNVTGYDLVKFLAGSYGTLAVLSEVTFKVTPAPETEATLALAGLDDRQAVEAMSAAIGSPWSVTGAAHLPQMGDETSRTLLRLEGFEASVGDRAQKLAAALSEFGAAERIPAETSAAVWRAVSDLAALGAPRDAPVWRISVRPSAAPAIADAARRAFPCRILYDWGGGLLWITGGEGPDGGAAIIRRAVREAGGHATLIRASAQTRLAVDVFEPQPEPVMELSRKLKHIFDPRGILNPGRMYPGV